MTRPKVKRYWRRIRNLEDAVQHIIARAGHTVTPTRVTLNMPAWMWTALMREYHKRRERGRKD